MVVGLIAIAAGLFLLTGVAPEEGPIRLLAGLALSGVGMGLNTGPAVSAAVGSVNRASVGIASGIVNLARMVRATLGVAVVVALTVNETVPAKGADLGA